ncbi:uncharacterized protein LOC143368826 [Andrena cerasifolii]|uniref:uncharacterized protein LOC143368826 n=1 Tax=Andrena cerasifolii TaxID=2819439 RepID=UPI0040383DB1
MQNIGSRDSLSKNVDAKVFCTNTQCQIGSEELANLRQQVTDLKETVVSLENIIKIKDVQLANTQRDNERLSVELKKQQRCVRNIKQQLDDERFFYQREKDYFNDEIQRQKTRCVSGTSRLRQQQEKLEYKKDFLEEENRSLREQLKEKAETTYNLCIKFLRMKYAKDSLRQKLDQLLNEHLQVMADMMEKLDEGRGELNIIVSEKFQEALPLSKAKFLQVVQRNARLVHENAMLKVQIQQLTLNIEKLRCCTQKPKLINVDAKIITKLAEQSGKKCSRESTKWLPFQLNVNDTEKCSSLTKPSTRQNSVDYSGDAKLLSKIRGNPSRKYADTAARQIQTKKARELRTECVRSAPDIVRTEAHQSCATISRTDSLVDFRDASTNT